jgi:hypothetical protein
MSGARAVCHARASARRGAAAAVAFLTVHCDLSAPTLPMSALPGPALAEVLDAGALERLRELDPGGKGGLVARVLLTYPGSLAKLLAQFNDARAQGNREALRHAAHTLKSSSASVGALQLSVLCADVESHLREGRTDGLEGKLDAMAAEGERVLAALRAT